LVPISFADLVPVVQLPKVSAALLNERSDDTATFHAWQGRAISEAG
jgi:hypothetical protein